MLLCFYVLRPRTEEQNGFLPLLPFCVVRFAQRCFDNQLEEGAEPVPCGGRTLRFKPEPTVRHKLKVLVATHRLCTITL